MDSAIFVIIVIGLVLYGVLMLVLYVLGKMLDALAFLSNFAKLHSSALKVVAFIVGILVVVGGISKCSEKTGIGHRETRESKAREQMIERQNELRQQREEEWRRQEQERQQAAARVQQQRMIDQWEAEQQAEQQRKEEQKKTEEALRPLFNPGFDVQLPPALKSDANTNPSDWP